MAYLILIYFFLLILFASFAFIVSYHYLRFRFQGDGSLAVLLFFLGYSLFIVLVSFILLVI